MARPAARNAEPASVNKHLTCCGDPEPGRARPEDRRVHAARGEMLRENNTRVRYLTDEEESRLIAALPEWLKPLIDCRDSYGAAKGRAAQSHLGRYRLREWRRSSCESRSRAKVGGCPMSATAHRTLTTLRQERRTRLSARVVNKSEASRFVFTAPQGGFMANLNRDWYPALKRADLEDLHFHDLRHSFASRLAMVASICTVQMLLGHKTPAMTLRYAHLARAPRAAVATLDAPGPKPWAAECGEVIADS